MDFVKFEQMLVEKYGLVAKEATKEAAPKSPPKKKVADMTPKEKCHHHIAEWTKKLGKSEDDDEKKKLQDKIDKENKTLADLAAGVAPEEKKPKGEKKTKKTEPKPKGENRVTKMTPTYRKYLDEACKPVGLPNGKELGHELINYINGLTDDEFKAKGLKDHITDFVTTKKATTVADEDEDEDESETEEAPAPTSNAAGGGPGDLPEIMTLDELQKLKLTATLPNKPGTFMNAATGKFVTGPVFDEDEESTEIKFNGKEYAVGDKTGRVYEVREGIDIFAGFVGVGQFKEMKV